ncbi:hypothetical protein [Streptomyces sp. NPDC051994]|uniref:hypothetical protein n=1 Tax=unclassified Streptomyces TaxID=2593676 RepID=UPI00342496FE
MDWAPLGVTLRTQLTGTLSGPFTPDGGNFAHLTNKRYQELTAKASKLPGATGCGAWASAESSLIGSGDLVPVVDKTLATAAHDASFHLTAGLFDATSIRMTGDAK